MPTTSSVVSSRRGRRSRLARDLARLAFTALLAFHGAASGQAIRLEDVTAGGDGSLNAPSSNTGIDPRTGLFVTSRFAGRIFDDGVLNVTAVPDSPYIDAVFFLGPAPDPTAGSYDQPITRSGVTVRLSTLEAADSAWNFILRDRVGGVSDPGIRVGGLDLFTSSIGLHASMGITFDLDALRARHGDAAVGCFDTFWGMDDCSIGRVNLLAVLSNDASGALATRNRVFTAGQGEFLSLPIPPEARYLTLITGPVGSDNCDHAVFARPIITPLPCPAPSYSWIWSLSPSRFAPAGGPITIDGELLLRPYSIYIGGKLLLNRVDESFQRVTGVVPALSPGVYDFDLLDPNFQPILKLPGAIEIVAAPRLTSIYPSMVLSDRPTTAYFYGENLRRDMKLSLDDGLTDGWRPLANQTFISDGAIRADLPALGPGVSSGQKSIVLEDQGRFYFYQGIVTYVDVGIERVDPSTVSTTGGTTVTFVGLNIAPSMTPRLGGSPLTSIERLDANHVRGKSPPLPEGYGSADLLEGANVIFTLQNAVVAVPPGPLTIVSVDPSRVFSLGGGKVTLVTSAPYGSAVPRVNGIPLVNAQAIDALSLRGEVPALDPGTYDVDLADDAGAILAVAPGALLVVANDAITISGVAPTVVSTLGGTEVTISGEGFSPGFVPRLGGVPLDGVEVLSATSLRGLSPRLDAGLKDATIQDGRLVLATKTGAVLAKAPSNPDGMYIGHVRPARVSRGTSRVRFVGARLSDDVVPRLGGVPLADVVAISPCRFEGTAPDLPPGLYRADLFRAGFGVVAAFDELVEVGDPGAPPRPTHIVSAPVLRNGSTRLFVFGNDFSSSTEILIGGRPLVGRTFVSDELIVGDAPPLAGGEAVGLRDVVAQDSRGSATLSNGIRYTEPDSAAVTFVRGDANASGKIDLSDAVYILGFLFLGSPKEISCLDAADTDLNGKVQLTDAVHLLQYLFLGGQRPGAPFPACGSPVELLLGCGSFAACGAGGGGGASARFVDHFKLIEESPVSALDPTVVEIAPEEGEMVLRDRPGGKDIQPGDVIAGFTPFHSDAIHNGVAYLLKVEQAIPGECLTAGAGEKVFKVRPASFKEAMLDADISVRQDDFFGARVAAVADQDLHVNSCSIVTQGLGAGDEQGQGGTGVFFDFDFGSFGVVDLQDGPNYLRAGFYRCKVLYNAGANLGIGISAGGISRLTYFAGLLLDSEVEFFVDANAFGSLGKEVKLVHLEHGALVFIGPVPILLTASGDLYAGVNIEAGVHMYVDAGAAAHFKAGLGFQFDGSSITNISGFDPPSFTPLPDTPYFDLDGFVKVKGYVKPEVSVFGGLLIKAVTAEIQIRSELFARAHIAGSTNPPCFDWGLDAGAKAVINPEIQLFGYDLFDETFGLFDGEWDDLIGGRIGCKAPPVVKLARRTDSLIGKMTIHLDASGSYDPDGGPLQFQWDFDNDGICDRNTGTNPRTTYVFQPGDSSPCGNGDCTHFIRVRATDDENTFTDATTSFVSRGILGLIQETEGPYPH